MAKPIHEKTIKGKNGAMYAYPYWLDKYRKERQKKTRKNTIRVGRYSAKINYYAYADLGEPKNVSIKFNPYAKEMTVTAGGTVEVYSHPKHQDPHSLEHVIHSIDINSMPKGSYEPVGNGVYRLVEDS